MVLIYKTILLAKGCTADTDKAFLQQHSQKNSYLNFIKNIYLAVTLLLSYGYDLI